MLLVPSHTVSSPTVHITNPPASLLRFPPDPYPSSVAPAVSDSTLARPFNINPQLYNDLLSFKYPLTFAILYATTVVVLSRLNTKRGNKPWAISQTRAFYVFVVLHNILFALYSAWTFVGMVNAFARSWPGFDAEGGATAIVDALCKINGPRGVGNAVSYNPSSHEWSVTNQAIKLFGGNPDSSDVGRIWNEGLAFYGWLFYLSKFYEVFDTLIILAKGKKSSFLQTYHHAGAMICMWAGIRYMSPPVWMFVLANSLVHALMYTYYALTALGIRVPPMVKRSLTTLQIGQFVIGVPYALAHLFIAYNIPVNTPYLYTYNIASALPSVASSVSSVVSSSVSSAFESATATAGINNWMKKIALRAAGNEGLAENVRDNTGHRFGVDDRHAVEAERKRSETRYRLEYPLVHCVDTSGQAFAIWLNVMYLAPLTYLFVNFFVRSYIARTSSSTKHPTHAHVIQKSGHDALKGVEREIHEAMGSDLSDMSPEIMRGSVHDAEVFAKDKMNDLHDSYVNIKEQAGPKVEELKTKVGEKYEDAKAQAGPKIDQMKHKAGETYENVKEQAAPKVEEAKSKASEAGDGLWSVLKSFARGTKQSGKALADKSNEAAAKAGEKIQEGRERAEPVVKEKAAQAADKAKEGADVASKKAEEGVNIASDRAKEGANIASNKAREGANVASNKAKEGTNVASQKAKEGATAASDKTSDVANQAARKAQEGKEKAEPAAKNAANKAKDTAGSYADHAKKSLQEGGDRASEKGKEVADTSKGKAQEAADGAAKKADEGREHAKEGVEKAKGKAQEGTEKVAEGGDKMDGEIGEGVGEGPGDAEALEASIDEIKGPEEDAAERAMQPEGL